MGMLTMVETRFDRVEAARAADWQDDAYTLAYYLLGDEARAAAAVTAALAQLPERAGRLAVLRRVLQVSRVKPGVFSRARHIVRPHQQPAADDLPGRLAALSADARTAAVLVDVLGLDYAAAGRVLDCSPQQAGRLLARGRVGLMRMAV